MIATPTFGLDDSFGQIPFERSYIAFTSTPTLQLTTFLDGTRSQLQIIERER